MKFKLNVKKNTESGDWEVWEEAHDPRTIEMDSQMGILHEDPWTGEMMFRADNIFAMSDLYDIINLAKRISGGELQ